MMRNVLSTGEIARLCKVAPRTVTQWIDNGDLKGFRIPGSKDRRVPTDELRAFLKRFNLDGHSTFKTLEDLLLIGVDSETQSSLIELLDQQNICYSVAQNAFEAGLIMASHIFDCILIDFEMDFKKAADLSRRIRDNKGKKCLIVGLSPYRYNLSKQRIPALSEVFERPFDPALLALRLQTLIQKF